MKPLDERILEAFEPTRPAGVPPDREGRFVLRGWLWSTPMLALTLSMYAANGWLFQSTLQVVSIAVAAGVVAWVRSGRSTRVASEVSLALVTLNFMGSALGQTPYDPSSLLALVIVPVAAAFVGGIRRGFTWAFITAPLALVTLHLGYRGYTVPDVDPRPDLTLSINILFEFVIMMALVKTYTEERDRAEEQIRAADRAKSIFLANVSHEIRTPMNGVVGMTEVLLQDQLTADQRASLGVIQRSGQALVLLINDLLDLARLEEGRFTLAPVRFDLRRLLSDLGQLYGATAAAKGLKLKVELHPEVPSAVVGDAGRLHQVLSNLLSNAVKFTAEGEVRCEVSRREGRLYFSVTDTGPGVPLQAQGRLFGRFEQGDQGNTRRVGGSGLGLALSREVVELMGGQLDFDASHHGGARFVFWLDLPLAPVDLVAGPRASTPPRALAVAAPPPSPQAHAPTTRGTVLVVDDNPINLAVARKLVSNAGFLVRTAVNGREALEAAQAGDFCMVLMDVQMPEMDGIEATRQIRTLPAGAGQVPVVGLTASAMPQDRAACLAAGMEEVLAKPIDIDLLTAALDRASPPRAVAA